MRSWYLFAIMRADEAVFLRASRVGWSTLYRRDAVYLPALVRARERGPKPAGR